MPVTRKEKWPVTRNCHLDLNCRSPKVCPPLISIVYAIVLHKRFAISGCNVPPHSRHFRNNLRPLLCASQPLARKPSLRQQLTVFKRKHPRPRMVVIDKLFWVLVQRFWSGWKQALIVVNPETVVRWHRAGFAVYWRAISRARRMIGRKRILRKFET